MKAGERKIKKLKMVSIAPEELSSFKASFGLHSGLSAQARTWPGHPGSGKL
jgi:hypothetical protein